MTSELNWCGQPIREGEGYGGKPENIPESCSQKPPRLRRNKNYEVIIEEDLAEVFDNGSSKLTRAEAAKLLEARTKAHRTSCYRALRLNGSFARHLHSDGTMLCWR